MSSSRARLRVAALSRPVITPVRSPAVRASESPCPSWASNVLISRADPSACESKVTAPVVSVPSTSINKTFICLALFLTLAEILRPVLSKSAPLLFPRLSTAQPRMAVPLNQLQAPQIMQMHYAQHASRLVYHHNRRNLALLHHIQCLAG